MGNKRCSGCPRERERGTLLRVDIVGQPEQISKKKRGLGEDIYI